MDVDLLFQGEIDLVVENRVFGGVVSFVEQLVGLAVQHKRFHHLPFFLTVVHHPVLRVKVLKPNESYVMT